MKGIHAYPPLWGTKIQRKRCEMENLFLEGISEDAKEEISILYNLGVEIEELEYLIRIKFRENLYLDSS